MAGWCLRWIAGREGIVGREVGLGFKG